ncbi:hypothetical protein KSP39_PZI002212 [Platanthera zijinensis]|uniref:Uncharacterized protein n=1 Tax=Platanthera zijinensis TaxID=2320716 RepID=A0AAP0GEB0_9ASPA
MLRRGHLYFAAKSRRICAEAIADGLAKGTRMEAFVEMCGDDYVQRRPFDSYLYNQVVPDNPLYDLKLAINTVGSLVKASALQEGDGQACFLRGTGLFAHLCGSRAIHVEF